MEKNKLLNQLKWRKLDNTAKIFPIISNKRFSSIFRLSVILKEDINKDILQKALEKSLEVFSAYKVKLKKGFFWYYFETNLKKPIVELEKDYPCKYISSGDNNDFLFKVTYYKSKINLEVFHSITDANGALEFLKLITYNYLSLIKNDKYHIIKENTDDYLYNLNAEDSYIKNYTKHHKNFINMKSAYTIKGDSLPLYSIGALHACISTKALLNICKSKNATISEYLTAKLIFSIYHVSYKKSKSKKDIKIYIPVNLKKYFNSSTISNFFSYITINAAKNDIKDFDFILEFVKNQFKTKLNKEELENKISNNVSAERNIFIRLIPLLIKKYSVKIGYVNASTHHTATLSNIGKIEVLKEYENDIDSFLFLISPSLSEKIKYSVCSYKDNLVINFCSCMQDCKIEKFFLENIAKDGIDINIQNNNIYENITIKKNKENKKNKERNISYSEKSPYYPILNSTKKNNFVVKLLLIISALVIAICLLVNILTTPNVHWSFICIIGITYAWLTTMYSIKRNKNLASHVLLQTICVFLVVLFIDFSIGYTNWSLNIALPIILLVSNTTMIILLLVTRKNYFKYMIYQIILSILSISPIFLLLLKITKNIVLTSICSSVFLLALLLTIFICGKEFKEELKRRFYF